MANFKGLTAKGVPPQPMFVFILRGVVIFFSVAILVACGVALSVFGSYGGYYLGAYTGAPGFMIFLTIKTMIILGAVLAVEKFAPHIYFRLAVVVAYVLNIIFWLSGWAWSASIAALFLKTTCVGRTCYYPGGDDLKYGGSMAAAAALGALNWVFMIVVLVFFVKACLADPEGTGAVTNNQAELGQVKHEAITPVQPYAQTTPGQSPSPAGQPPYVPPEQGYPPQQYPPQQGYPPQQYPPQQTYPAPHQ